MVDLDMPAEMPVQEPKPTRKKAAKAEAAPAEGGVRQWADVVVKIRALKDGGATVPQIAEELEVDYVLVNQVMVQSYKMTVDTLAVFERQEKRRLGIAA
jgi:endonuclease/exonuclease/phosphatase family metal-dependent hydrolase